MQEQAKIMSQPHPRMILPTDAVTFGGSGLNRRADLRAQAQALLAAGAGQCALFWRGKPLIAGPEGQEDLLFLNPDHPLIAACAQEDALFLGVEGQGDDLPQEARFALNLTHWTPDLGPDGAWDSFADHSAQTHPLAPDGARFVELRQVMMRLDPRAAEYAATARALFNWHDSHRFCARCGGPSDVILGGWQRLCPACGASHFPRTDPVVIMLVCTGDKLLLGRSHGWPEGMYSLLAGFVEPGETLEAAVRREVAEETGIRIGAVQYIACQPWPYPNSLMLGCAAQAQTDRITVDPNELDDALWVTRQEMVDIMIGRHPRITPPRKGAIARFLVETWLADRFNSR